MPATTKESIPLEELPASKKDNNKSSCSIVKYITIIHWLPKYSRLDAVSDLVAGFSLGLTLIPQSIAYAALAGLTAQVYLYSLLLTWSIEKFSSFSPLSNYHIAPLLEYIVVYYYLRVILFVPPTMIRSSIPKYSNTSLAPFKGTMVMNYGLNNRRKCATFYYKQPVTKKLRITFLWLS